MHINDASYIYVEDLKVGLPSYWLPSLQGPRLKLILLIYCTSWRVVKLQDSVLAQTACWLELPLPLLKSSMLAGRSCCTVP